MPAARASFERYLHTDGPEINMKIARTELASAGEEQFTTFSMQAVMEVADHMHAWVQSRLIREVERLGKPPEALHVAVRMTTDVQAEAAELLFDWQRDWLAQAGEGRLSRFSPQAMAAVHDKLYTWVLEQLMRLQKATTVWPQEMELSVHAAASTSTPRS